MTYDDLLQQVSSKRVFTRPDLLIVFDPGKTTGWAVFWKGKLSTKGHQDTGDLNSIAREVYGFLAAMISRPEYPDPKSILVLYENYRVYGHKVNQHTWNDLHTPKLIGLIEASCQLLDLPTHHQMAATAKPFCTDKKLKEWGYYQKAHKHANDAIRHGCYYLLFGAPK